jgi:hypothetical protein
MRLFFFRLRACDMITLMRHGAREESLRGRISVASSHANDHPLVDANKIAFGVVLGDERRRTEILNDDIPIQDTAA